MSPLHISGGAIPLRQTADKLARNLCLIGGESQEISIERIHAELRPGDVDLQRFSPTGFYSSAVSNDFLRELHARSDRQNRA